MTFVPIVCATAVPRTSGPARHTSSRMAAIGGVIMRPDVNEASRLPPSLNPEIRPNKHGAMSASATSRLKSVESVSACVDEVRSPLATHNGRRGEKTLTPFEQRDDLSTPNPDQAARER